jgi:hypothetical protein
VTITAVASLEFSEEEEIQSCAFGRKLHGDNFLRLGKIPAGGNHEKRNQYSFRGASEYAEKANNGCVVSEYTGGWKSSCR